MKGRPYSLPFAVVVLAVTTLATTIGAQDPSAPTGTLAVRVEPAASLYVDGKLIPKDAAEQPLPIEAGPHRLRILHPDYLDLRRTIEVRPNQTLALTLTLAEKAVRKAGPAPVQGRNPAAKATTIGGAATDVDLIRGIQFIVEGDFAPASDTLLAVARNLAGVPRLIGQQALAYFYLGVAWIELDRQDQAARAFALARRLDRTLAPSAAEFSKQVLEAWERARSTPADEELDLVSVQPQPSVDTENRPPASEPPGATPNVSEAEFIADSANAVRFEFVTSSSSGLCAGILNVDRTREIVEWAPAVPECRPAFSVPFVEVRSPAAAPHGGVLLQFRSERPSIVLMPAPDADLLEPGTDPLLFNDLPASTKVNMRRAQRRLLEALGRPPTDSLFGLLVDVSLGELLESPTDYEGGVVRTRGRLAVPARTKDTYALVDEDASVALTPTAGAAFVMKARAAELASKELIVSGTFGRPALSRPTADGKNVQPFVITASAVEPADRLRYEGPARPIALESLVKAPPRDRGDLVRVIGKFRGQNFFGDLPQDSRRSYTDWVIKDEVFSVWVTGKPPAGSGFALNSSSTKDAFNYWLAITGTVEERKGFVYLRAEKVELTSAPSDVARAVDPRMPTGLARARPDVTFTAPVEGIEEASRDQQFLIQFTKAMDEASIRAHVQLRYADAPTMPFPRQSLTYYADRKFSVIIDPGTALQPGRTVECVLLPGLKDIDNQLLVGTDSSPRVFRWKVRNTR